MNVEYREIVGFLGYRVGSDGTVWTCFERFNDSRGRIAFRITSEWRELSQTYNGRGGQRRLCVNLRIDGKTRNFRVSSLVAMAFLGECPEGKEIAHFPDRNPGNNAACNLQYVTHLENIKHKVIHGTQPRGEKSVNCTITKKKAKKIKRELSEGKTVTDVSRRYGVSYGIAYHIKKGSSWQWLEIG